MLLSGTHGTRKTAHTTHVSRPLAEFLADVYYVRPKTSLVIRPGDLRLVSVTWDL